MTNHIDENIKAVFFDHDDTLVGTFASKSQHHKFIAKQYYQKDLTDEEIRLHWGKPLEELVCLLYETTDADQAMTHNKAHHMEFPKELFVATIPILKRVKAAGLYIGIVTATSRYSFEHDLDFHKIPRTLIDFTQTSQDTPYHKPDPRVFDPALEWLADKNIAPHEVIYIGDGLHDMKAAVGAGFNFLGVETGLVTAEEFKAAGGKSLPSIAELYQLEN